jgi:hypothetical protein
METIKIEIDVALARDYVRKYRKFLRDKHPPRSRLTEFLRDFTEDRLREEIEFVENELDTSAT